MSGSRLVLPVQQPVTSAGLPYAGGSLYFYVTGTNTLTPTYSDVGLTVANSNPIILDSAGEFGNVFLPQNIVYKIVLFDANGNQIWSYDPVYALAPVSSSGLIWCGNSSGTANSQTVTAPGFATVDGTTIIFIASYSNTSALTVNPNSTTNYPVYKDADAGPVVLTGGEVESANLVELTYSSALGGFHILNNRASNNAFTNLASSATTDLGSLGNHNLTITGTTGITAFGSSAFVGNPIYNLVFSGSLTLTNSAGLALPGNVNKTTQSGDFATAQYLGSGNWRVLNYFPAVGSVSPSVAAFNGLKIVTTSTTALTVTATAISVLSSTYSSQILTSVSVTINTGTSGANGLDTGSIAGSTWYAVYVIYNPTTATTAGLLSLSGTTPTLPSGYTYAARVGWVRENSTPALVQTIQYGNRAQYLVGATGPTTAYPIMATGTASANTAISVSNYVPTTSAAICLVACNYATGGAIAVSSNANKANGASSTNPPDFSTNGSSGIYVNSSFIIILESSNIYWGASVASIVACAGWVDNL